MIRPGFDDVIRIIRLPWSIDSWRINLLQSLPDRALIQLPVMQPIS